MKPTPVLKRFAAFFIDYIILVFLSLTIAFLFVEVFSSSSSKTFLDSAKMFWDNTVRLIPGQEPSMFNKFIDKFSFYLTHMRSGIMICGIVTFIYFVFFEQSKWQGTIGKKLLKIKVKDSQNKRLTLPLATKRFLLFATPALVFYFIIFFISPQCLQIVNMHFNLFKLKIEIPAPCMTLSIIYTICYLIWFVPIFFTKNKLTFYDALSKTQVKG